MVTDNLKSNSYTLLFNLSYLSEFIDSLFLPETIRTSYPLLIHALK